MAERPVALEGLNLGLSALVCLAWIGVGLVYVGPGRTAVSTAREKVEESQARIDRWEEKFRDSLALDELERISWSGSYAQLNEFGASSADELALTRFVATQLRAPSLRGLEVVRDGDPADDEAEIEIRSPESDRGISLRRVALSVEFEADYEDLSSVLERIDSPENALEIRHIKLDRHRLAVRVKLDLDLWTRLELDS